MSKTITYFKYLFRRILLSWRMLAVFIVSVLTMDTFLAPIRSYCQDMDIKVSPWGFALIWDNKYVGLCFLLIYILGISNFPEDRGKERYSIARIGISNWVGAQALFMMLFGWLYTYFLYAVQNLLLIGVTEWSNEWGEGWTNLINSYVTEYFDIFITIPKRVLSNYSPEQANFLVFLIMGLLLGMIGMLVMWLNFYAKSAGTLAATAMVFMSLAAQRYIRLYRYSPVNWIQLENHYNLLSPEKPKQGYIILMLIFLTALLFMLSKNRANHTQENNRRKL